MAFFFLLPEIHAKDVSKQNPSEKTINGKKARGSRVAIYNHWEMIQDKLNGLSWGEVANKYHVPSTIAVSQMLLYSKASRKLTPEQVEKLFIKGDRA